MLLLSPYPVAGPCPILRCGEPHTGRAGAWLSFPVGKQDPSPGVRSKWFSGNAKRRGTPGSVACIAPGLGRPRDAWHLSVICLFFLRFLSPPRFFPAPRSGTSGKKQIKHFNPALRRCCDGCEVSRQRDPRPCRCPKCPAPLAAGLQEVLPPWPCWVVAGRPSIALPNSSLRAVLTWEFSSASLFAACRPSCKKLLVLRPGCQNLQLPTQTLLEPFCVQMASCLSFPPCKTRLSIETGIRGSPSRQGVLEARGLICTYLLIALLFFLNSPPPVSSCYQVLLQPN